LFLLCCLPVAPVVIIAITVVDAPIVVNFAVIADFFAIAVAAFVDVTIPFFLVL